MSKPTVRVAPDDGGGKNIIVVGRVALFGIAPVSPENHYRDNEALYHAIERLAELEAERDNAHKLMEKYEDQAQVQPGFWGGFASRQHLRADKAEQERDALARLIECESDHVAMVDRITALLFERDALAAHVERIRETCLDSGKHVGRRQVFELQEFVYDAPQTSLAQRDARMKAEALEGVVERPIWTTVYAAKSSIKEIAVLYRQQAEENNQ